MNKLATLFFAVWIVGMFIYGFVTILTQDRIGF